MNSLEKKARIVCRMKSVEVTRVMPRRWAASVASVDLPVPVEPPTRRTIGMLELLECVQPAQPAYRLGRRLLADHVDRELREPVEVEGACAARGHVGVGARRQLVGARGPHAGGRQRAGHEPLRPRRVVLAAERQRGEVTALAHAATASASRRIS